MLMDPMGGIVMTNDGNAILREVKKFLPYSKNFEEKIFFHTQLLVQHPAAKSMIEISRTQDEEVGDGTTSVIILGRSLSYIPSVTYLPLLSLSSLSLFSLSLVPAGEILAVAEPFLQQQMHPTVIIRAFRQALDDILTICKEQIGWVWSRDVGGRGLFFFPSSDERWI